MDAVVQFAAAAAAIGLLAMAIIQSVKDMVPVRRWYQQAFVRAWLARNARVHARRGGSAPDVETACDDLVRLATTGDAHALFDLPIEQLGGQVSSAAAQALDYPARHEDLVRCLAASAAAADVDAVLDSPGSAAPGDVEAAATIDARTRVMHQVQRGIDALQISLGFRWKWILQLAAFGVSYAIAVAAVTTSRAPAPAATTLLSALLSAVPLAIAGGFIAPVARDLIVALTARARA